MQLYSGRLVELVSWQKAMWATWAKSALLLGLWLLLLPVATASPTPSTCVGIPAAGSLKHGWALPSKGRNYIAYSGLGVLVGRTYVHSQIYPVLLDAYAALERDAPGVQFVYGETGWAEGGAFAPHKTHQNGLSVDFFVPVKRAGTPASLPIWPWNQFGYGVEFDSQGRYRDLRIDFDAMAAHLLALASAAKKHGVGIRLVIFDNALQSTLWQTRDGEALRQQLPFSVKKPWVRHDEHYHVDFLVPCQPR